MNLLIREAQENDYEMVNLLAYELYHDHFINRSDIFNDTIVCFGKETFINEIKSDNSNILVIEDALENKIIGYTCFQLINKQKTLLKCSRTYLSIDDLVISEKYRKIGLATTLHQRIINFAQKHNCSSIELDVFHFNKTALAFYENLGYQYKNHSMELFL